MPLSAVNANLKTKAINDFFAAIGNSKETAMPRSKGNLEPLAWEVLVAKHLKRIAAAREKKAVAAAVKAGVMFDPEKQPLPIGTQALIYAGDVVEIAVAVSAPGSHLDQPALIEDLEKAGLKLPVVNRLFNKHTSENRAPHMFTATIATSR